MLAAVLVLGTTGYMLLERWPLLDALYMTVTTISTVGFSEVHPLNTPGRIFTIGLILGGVGTIFYAFGVLAEIVFEGDIARYRRKRSMDRRREALREQARVRLGVVFTPLRVRNLRTERMPELAYERKIVGGCGAKHGLRWASRR